MSTLRTHKDYVKALAYAKEREQVNTKLIVVNLLADNDLSYSESVSYLNQRLLLF